MEKLSLKEVSHVAGLARLSLNDEEMHRMQEQLNAILGTMEVIQALDVSGVEPTNHAVPLTLRLREDVVKNSLDRQEILAAAPSSDAGGFAVKKAVHK